MSQKNSGSFDEPDSMSDQKGSEGTSPDSTDTVVSNTSQSPSAVSSASESNVSCSNETPLTSQNCSVLRKSFLNQVSDTGNTSEDVVSTTPKFQLKSSSFASSVLKPSALSSPLTSGSGFALKAPTLKNPFAKKVSLIEVSDSTESGSRSNNSEEVSSSEQVSSPGDKESSSEQNPASSSSSLSQSLVSPPKFTPLLATSTSSSNSASSSTASGFVFGQNLRDRVETAEEEQVIADNSNNTASSTPTNAFASSNGTTDMLFTSVLQKETADKIDSGGEENGTAPPKSLSEAAREYEEARANKRKYEAVAVVTGEEEESNVLQINCKLFLYDSVKTWIELGRGHLRLNDISNSLSRIVIRCVGSLRVILNTKIWAGMVVQKASDNSVRLTAKENGQAKVYLVKASPKEIDQLFKALEWRVNNQKKLGVENGNSNGVESEDDVEESKKHKCEDLVSNGPSTGAASATQPGEHST